MNINKVLSKTSRGQCENYAYIMKWSSMHPQAAVQKQQGTDKADKVHQLVLSQLLDKFRFDKISYHDWIICISMSKCLFFASSSNNS